MNCSNNNYSMLSAIMIENEISETKNAMSLHIFCFLGINLTIIIKESMNIKKKPLDIKSKM